MDNLISVKNPKSQAAEAFRTLRTNVQFANLDDDLKVITVTSSGLGEGKSTIVSNLAITMAQSGKKVLLIDCDLRRPTIHKKFNIDNKNGVTSIIANSSKINECTQKTTVNNLSIITCGPLPPNPSELLGSKKMKTFVEEVSEHFDFVLLDAPPVLLVTDALILSTYSDSVILVAAHGTTEKSALLKTKTSIENVGGKICGVVCNKIPKNSKSYYSYNYTYSTYK